MAGKKHAGTKAVHANLKPKKTVAKPAKPSKKQAIQAAAKPVEARAAPVKASKAAAAAAAGVVTVNRAPVLTLWVAVVAQRQGFSFAEGLTFGKLVAGWFAQSKGRSLGIYEPKEVSEEERLERQRQYEELGVEHVDCFGLQCPALKVGDQLHAVADGKAILPGSVRGSLTRAFGDRLEDVKEAMETLAAAIPPARIGQVAYQLYERFRPEWRGWGAKGELDLGEVAALAEVWEDQLR